MIFLLDVQILGQIYSTQRFVRRRAVHRCRIKLLQVPYAREIHIYSSSQLIDFTCQVGAKSSSFLIIGPRVKKKVGKAKFEKGDWKMDL